MPGGRKVYIIKLFGCSKIPYYKVMVELKNSDIVLKVGIRSKGAGRKYENPLWLLSGGNGIIERYREKHDYVQFIFYSFLNNNIDTSACCFSTDHIAGTSILTFTTI